MKIRNGKKTNDDGQNDEKRLARVDSSWGSEGRELPRRRTEVISTMFHVPELSRGCPMIHPVLAGTRADGNNGAFDVASPEPGWRLACLASDGEGWEHVSIHAYNTLRTKQRCPSWKEMSYVKRLFWDGVDVVMQLHPREDDFVNCHPHVLHLWRPTTEQIPTPPPEFVGPPNERTGFNG